MYRTGYVGVLGKPNAGKSTLVNALVGEKVAIVSSKPQTTRDNIIGIMNGENYQVILVDTPGIHHSKNKLDKYMMKNVRSAIGGVDEIIYLIDGSKQSDQEEKEYIEKLKSGETPVLIVKTKIDKPNKFDGPYDYQISSLTGEGVAALKERLIDDMPESEIKNFIYDSDYYTDKSIKFLIAESLREECLNFFREEVPHGIAIDITRFDEKSEITIIEADIICEHLRHKGIIIGKGGVNLKEIGRRTRCYAEEVLGQKVLLKLFVKVEEGWRDNQAQLRNLGYKDVKR